MSERKVLRRSLKKYAVGDLRERITIHQRDIKSPGINSAEFSEAYDAGFKIWASVVTFDLQNSGYRLFTDVNLNDEQPTHKFIVRYNKDVNSEKIISWRGSYYKIITIRNPEERNQYLELYSVLIGKNSIGANQ